MDMRGWTPQMHLMFGLSEIIEAAKKRIPGIVYSGRRGSLEVVTELPEHPFGLPLPNRRDQLRLGRWREVAFLGHPGVTDPSVNTFLAYTLEHLTRSLADSVIRQMRTILVANEPLGRGHEVFFEISIGDDTYMCGGCTDNSGAGGEGKDRIESVFAVLSALSGVPVEAVTLSAAEGKMARGKILGLMNA
jgi:hypothetical protein